MLMSDTIATTCKKHSMLVAASMLVSVNRGTWRLSVFLLIGPSASMLLTVEQTLQPGRQEAPKHARAPYQLQLPLWPVTLCCLRRL